MPESKKNSDVDLWLDEYRKNYTGLYRLAREITNSRELAQEIMQDVPVKLLEVQPEYINDNAAKAYLYRTARNLSINVSKHESHASPTDKINEQTYGHGAKTESDFKKVELKVWIESYCIEYPAELREAYAFYVLDGIAIKELANELGMKHTTLKKKFERMRIRIQMKIPSTPNTLYEITVCFIIK